MTEPEREREDVEREFAGLQAALRYEGREDLADALYLESADPGDGRRWYIHKTEGLGASDVCIGPASRVLAWLEGARWALAVTGKDGGRA